MKVKKIMASALAASMLLTGCGNAGNDNGSNSNEIVTEVPEGTKITFWHAMNGEQEKALTDITEAFMKENPNITVELQNQGSYNDLSSKIVATSQSPKDLPTLTQAYPGWVLNAMNDGLLVDFKPYMDNETLKFDNYEDILEGIRKAIEKDGKVYAMPFSKSTEVLWYNKGMLEEVGKEVPTTLEELADVSKAIYEKFGIAGCGFDSLNNFYVTYLAMNGQELTKDLDVTGEASVAAVQYLLDGINEGYFRLAGTGNYFSTLLGQKEVGMYVGSNAGESYVKQGAEASGIEYGVAPYPSSVAIQQGPDVYMFTSASAEQRTAAYLYLKYLLSTDNQAEWAVRSGYMPARTSAINSDKYQNSDSKMPAILEDATDSLFTMPNSEGSNKAYNDIKTAIEAILAAPQGKDAKTEMETFKATYDAAWQQ